MASSPSVPNTPLVSDERLRNVLQRLTDRPQLAARDISLEQLAAESGVNIHTLHAIRSSDPAKRRRITIEDAFSIMAVLGEHAVSALLATIGYSARRLDDPDELHPMMIAATAMQGLSTIATAAADGRIDHTEQPLCRDAADLIIATVLPLSSAGTRA